MAPTEAKNFYVFGDSICFGQYVSHHLTWVGRLSSAINEIPGQKGRVMLNSVSINGNTTRMALERMPHDVTSHQVDFCLIQFGMNDCHYWATDRGVPRVSPKAFAANLEEMVERLMAIKTKQIFMDTNHPSLKGSYAHLPSRTYAQSNAEYNEITRSVHEDLRKKGYPIELIDIETKWKDLLATDPLLSLSDLLLPDGVHPSEKGHELYHWLVTPIVVERIGGMLG